MELKLCVVIPVHKPNLYFSEIISIKQCRKILHNYPVFLIFPKNMDISEYINIFPELRLQPVDEQWLSSIENYNRMKRSLDFYQLFDQYQFMLTYELDAYIFSTDWNKAYAFDYDYIGAPWFEGYSEAKSTADILGVGNSGFSIRNIKSCIQVILLRERVKTFWKIFNTLHLHHFFRLTLFLKIFNKKWNINGRNVFFFSFMTEEHINEDNFWASIVPQLLDFKIAPVQNAIKFSYEVNPDILYKLNNSSLPIGCHAWEKYNKDFWLNFIKENVKE